MRPALLSAWPRPQGGGGQAEPVAGSFWGNVFQARVRRKVINRTPVGAACGQITRLATQKAITMPGLGSGLHAGREVGSGLSFPTRASKGSPPYPIAERLLMIGTAGLCQAGVSTQVPLIHGQPGGSHKASPFVHKGPWPERGSGCRVGAAHSTEGSPRTTPPSWAN